MNDLSNGGDVTEPSPERKTAQELSLNDRGRYWNGSYAVGCKKYLTPWNLANLSV